MNIETRLDCIYSRSENNKNSILINPDFNTNYKRNSIKIIENTNVANSIENPSIRLEPSADLHTKYGYIDAPARQTG